MDKNFSFLRDGAGERGGGGGGRGREKFALNASGPFVISNVKHCGSHLQLPKYRLSTFMRKFKVALFI